MPLAREDCYASFIAGSFLRFGTWCEAQKVFSKFKESEAKEMLSCDNLSWQPHGLVMMYHFNFYNIVAQFAWELQTCEIRYVLMLGIVVYGLDEIGVFQMWNS